MKRLFLVFAIALSTSAHARQYIQCSSPDANDTTAIVINLPSEEQGTLYLVPSADSPEDQRALVQITLKTVSAETHLYSLVLDEAEGEVAIPSSILGQSSDRFEIDLLLGSLRFPFLCFTRIYND